MKLTVGKDQLLAVLTLSQKFSSTKLGTSPILQGVLMESNGKEVYVYATNLVHYYTALLPCEGIEGEGSFVLEPKKLTEYLQLLSPKSPITLTNTDHKIIVTQDTAKGTFSLMSPDDFPKPPVSSSELLTIPAKLLTEELSSVLFASSKEDTRPTLTGTLIKQQGDDLLFVATDGFRLSHLMVNDTSLAIDGSIVPSSFLEEVGRYINQVGVKDVSLAYHTADKLLHIIVGNTHFYTRLIDGQFPAYEKVIPTNKTATIEVDREELLRAVRQVGIFARDVSNIVVCEIHEKDLLVRPKGELKDNSTSLPVRLVGEEITIAFNLKYLTDFLSRRSEDTIIFELLRPDAPAVIRIPGNDQYFHLIMPVRVQE